MGVCQIKFFFVILEDKNSLIPEILCKAKFSNIRALIIFFSQMKIFEEPNFLTIFKLFSTNFLTTTYCI